MDSTRTASKPAPSPAAVLGSTLLVVAAAATVAFVALLVRDSLQGQTKIPWVLGRASGVTSYVLLVCLVATGLVLSHPWARGRALTYRAPKGRRASTSACGRCWPAPIRAGSICAATPPIRSASGWCGP